MPLSIFRGDVSPQADGTSSNYGLIANSLNELKVASTTPDLHVLASNGEYFVAKTATPGTGVALITSLTSFATTDTQPSAVLINGNAAGGNRIYLDYIKLILTATQLPTTATNIQIAVDVDSSPTRYTSGGTALTPVNVNMDSGNATKASVFFGATIVAVAGSVNRRVMWSDYVEPIVSTTPAAAAGDRFEVKFGGIERGAHAEIGTLVAGSPLNVKKVAAMGPPIIIGGQQTMCVRIWGAGLAAAPTYEFELGYWERY